MQVLKSQIDKFENIIVNPENKQNNEIVTQLKQSQPLEQQPEEEIKVPLTQQHSVEETSIEF